MYKVELHVQNYSVRVSQVRKNGSVRGGYIAVVHCEKLKYGSVCSGCFASIFLVVAILNLFCWVFE